MNYRRIIRRATHASRSIPAVIMAVLVIAGAGWVLTEIVLQQLNRPALLISPLSMRQAFLSPEAIPHTPAVVGGALAMFVGIAAILFAMKPGRLRKHHRNAVIVDDALIARFIARELARTVQLPDSHVAVRLSRRYAKAKLTPLSGLPIPAAQVEQRLQALLDRDDFQPRLKAHVTVAKVGKVA